MKRNRRTLGFIAPATAMFLAALVIALAGAALGSSSGSTKGGGGGNSGGNLPATTGLGPGYQTPATSSPLPGFVPLADAVAWIDLLPAPSVPAALVVLDEAAAAAASSPIEVLLASEAAACFPLPGDAEGIAKVAQAMSDLAAHPALAGKQVALLIFVEAEDGASGDPVAALVGLVPDAE